MQSSAGVKTVIGVSCLLGVLMVAGNLAMQQREKQLADRMEVLHTYKIIANLETLTTAMNEAETGQRGFLLTGNESYLKPFTDSKTKIDSAILKIRLLTKDSSDHQKRVAAIAFLIKDKMTELSETIQIRREKGLDAAMNLVKNDSGQRFMDDFRSQIEAMKTSEKAILDSRSAKLDAETKKGLGALIQLLALSMVAIGVSAVIVYNAFMVRKRSQAETEEQKKMLQIMLDTMSDGVVIADENGTFRVFNPAAEKIFGKIVSMDPARWSDYYGIFASDGVTPVPLESQPLARAMKGEIVDDMEVFVRNKENPQGRWILATAIAIDSESYGFKGGMVVCRDITEKREAEKRVSEFYSTVSHELRTPLTSIRASLGLIEGGIGGEVSDKAKKLVVIARESSDRLIRLINDILDISKIEAGRFELSKKIVETHALIEKTLNGIRGMAQERSVTIKEELKTTGPLDCDEDRIVQVLTNFISNAIKFSPKDSTVIVRLEPGAPGYFKFSVIDNGPGIPQEQMHKLFGKFQQLDSSDSRKNEGTGLGLAISKALVENHGGRLGVESEVGVGSSFWVELPANFNPRLLEDNQEEKRAHHPALIVEDDDAIFFTLKEHLAMDGFSIVRAATIGDAEKILLTLKPFVIILDLSLPDGSGIDLFHKLSNKDELKDIPVIVVTGSDRDSQLIAEPALIDWITKPYDEGRLHKALDIAREKRGPAKILIIEDDHATRETVKTQLESIGAKCFVAEDGARALTAIRQENPDLIILDLDIPQPDGYAVVDILKSEECGMKPLIVYTASDLTEEQRQKLHLGLSAHLTKSRTTQEEFVQTVRSFLNGLLLGKESQK